MTVRTAYYYEMPGAPRQDALVKTQKGDTASVRLRDGTDRVAIRWFDGRQLPPASFKAEYATPGPAVDLDRLEADIRAARTIPGDRNEGVGETDDDEPVASQGGQARSQKQVQKPDDAARNRTQGTVGQRDITPEINPVSAADKAHMGPDVDTTKFKDATLRDAKKTAPTHSRTASKR